MQRWLLLSTLIAGLVLVGLATLRGDLLALAIPLLIYAGAALLGRPAPPQLSATRSFSAQRLANGEPAQVSVSITNMGARSTTVLLEDQLPQRLALIEGQPRMLATIAPGASVELEYTVAGARGLYQFPGLHANLQDQLGLFHTTTALPAPGPAQGAYRRARRRREFPERGRGSSRGAA